MDIKIDASQWQDLEKRVASAGKNGQKALRRALTHTGKKAKTAMARALVGQTGLKYKTTNKSLVPMPGNDAYTLKIEGGNIRLKFFKARETRKGVSAAPWNSRRTYAGTFMKGGRFPNRKALNMGGQVFKRAGGGRTPLKVVKSGLYLPTEAVTGASASAFYSSAHELAGRLIHELGYILK